MPTLLVYKASDFEGGLPAESGAAAGSGWQELTLKADAKPVEIVVADNDRILDEVDGDQSIGADVELDGVKYAAGSQVHSSYDILNSDSGLKVTGLHIGGTGGGYQQGAVQGVVASEPLVPGQTYKFDINRTSHRKSNDYEDYAVCFLRGTWLRTPYGLRPIESLSAGDMLVTHDHGNQPIRWIGSQRVSGLGALAPLRICSAADPRRPLFVSPQHRVMLPERDVSLITGAGEALVAAVHLKGVRAEAEPRPWVEYWHLCLDRHEMIWADGHLAETLFLGPQAQHMLGRRALHELEAIFGSRLDLRHQPVRPFLRGWEAQVVCRSPQSLAGNFRAL